MITAWILFQIKKKVKWKFSGHVEIIAFVKITPRSGGGHIVQRTGFMDLWYLRLPMGYGN